MLAVLSVPPANAESNPAQVLGRMLDLYKELKTGDKLRAEPQEFEEVRTDDSVGAQSAYKIGEFRLGEHVTPSTLRGYVCKPSDQFAGSTWRVRSKRLREGRGESTLSESLLASNDGKVVYVNRSYAPAFFDANEIDADIERKSRQLSETARIQRSPRRAGLPDGTIALWGGVSLKPLEGQALELVAREQSPNAGFIIDLLIDPALSARSGLPVYRIGGDAPGYVWAATVGPDGVGRLRFLAIDPRQASLRVAVDEESKQPDIAAPPTSKIESKSYADDQGASAQSAAKVADDKREERLPLSDPRSFNAKLTSSYGVDPTLLPLIKDCRDPTTGQTFDCPPDDPNNPLKKLPTGACVREKTGKREECPNDPEWHRRQDTRLAAEKAAQQAEEAKRQAALQVARAKRDPNDVVEQVLNYTVTGSERGTENNFWFKPDATQQCVFERMAGFDETNNKLVDVINVFATAFRSIAEVKSIDLNQLATNGLGIEYADKFKQYVLTHDGQPLFFLSHDADPDRVKRGWKLIYEEGPCKGLKRAF